jgi:ABC-type phosphate/phosphonate transport system ATPase subunit
MIFQQFNLVGRLTVLENVLAGRLAYRDAILPQVMPAVVAFNL